MNAMTLIALLVAWVALIPAVVVGLRLRTLFVAAAEPAPLARNSRCRTPGRRRPGAKRDALARRPLGLDTDAH